MATIKLKRGLESKVSSLPKEDGSLIFGYNTASVPATMQLDQSISGTVQRLNLSVANSGTSNYSKNSGALGGSSLSQILAQSGSGNAFTAIDTATNSTVKLTRANGGTVQKIIDNVAHATSATIASTANLSKNSNALGGSSLSQITNYINNKDIKVTRLINQDLNTLKTPGFYYAAGSNSCTNKPSGIDAFGLEVIRTADGYYTQRLTSANIDSNSIYTRYFNSSSWSAWTNTFNIKASTASTADISKNSNALGGSSLQNIIDKINTTSGSGNAFTGLDTTTNNVIKLTRANGGTVQKTIDNVAHATSATLSSTANIAKNSNALGGSSLSQVINNSIKRYRIVNNVSSGYEDLNGTLPPFIYSYKIGKPLHTDPEFSSGLNGIRLYDNAGSGKTSLSRISMKNGNSSGYVIEIKNIGSGPNPGLGGWYFGDRADYGLELTCIFRAKIPAGYSVVFATNSIGTHGFSHWLTENAGTGKWEWYAFRVCGGSENFSSTMYFYLSGTAGSESNPVKWYLSYANTIVNSHADYDGLRTIYSDEATNASTANLAKNSNALGGSSLQNIIDKINTTSGSGNAFTGLDTATNNVVKLTRANGGTVQKTIDNVAHATSASNSDKLDGYNENSFLRYRGSSGTNHDNSLWNQIGIKEYDNAYPDDLTDGKYNYGEVISLPSANVRFDLWVNHQSSSGATNGIQYRSGWGDDKKSWRMILDSTNYISYAADRNAFSGLDTATNNVIKLTRANGGTVQKTINNVAHSSSADISTSSNRLNSRGNVTAIGTTQTLDWSGLWMSNVYNNGYPTSYGNLINLHGGGYGQILIGWGGGGITNPGNFIRSKRDVASEPWTPWARIITSLDALNSSSSAISSTNNYFTAGATTAYIASKLSSSSADKTAFTGLDTTTNNIIKLTRANGGTVQKTIDNVAHSSTSSYSSNSGQLQGYQITTTSSGSSATFGNKIPLIHSDGILELSRYIDFHGDSTSRDYSIRLDSGIASNLVITGPSASTVTASYFNGNAKNSNALNGSSLSQILTSAGSGKYLPLTGGTLTGTLSGPTANFSTLSATTIKGPGEITYRTYSPHLYQQIDLSSTVYDQNKWYPVVGDALPYYGFTHISCNVQLNSGTKPEWSTHKSGFSCNLDILAKASGWGTTGAQSIIRDYSYSFSEENPLSYIQLTNSSRPCIYMRGGGRYKIYTSNPLNWTVSTSPTTYTSQMVQPQSSCPNISISRSTAYVNIDGLATTANIAKNSNALGGSSLSQILSQAGSGNAFTSIDTATNNVIKLTRANGGTVQKIVNNVSNATSASIASTSQFLRNNNGNTQFASWTASLTDNNSTGRSWYGFGTYINSSDNLSWFNLSNYYGINITTSNHNNLQHNGSIVLDASNYTSYAADRNAFSGLDTTTNNVIKLTRANGGTVQKTINNVANSTSATISSTANIAKNSNALGGSSLSQILSSAGSGKFLPLTGGTLTGPLTVPKINLNRSASTTAGRISFYSPSFYTWFDYMSDHTSGNAPTGATPSSYGNVTSWARRSLIENANGYGWIWESSSNSSGSIPSPMMSLSSQNGYLYVKGVVTASSFNGMLERVGKSVSWHDGNKGNGVLINQTSYTGWNPILRAKTTDGVWTFGPYASNILYLNYTSDATIAGTVNTCDKKIKFYPNGDLQGLNNVTASTFTGYLNGNAKNSNALGGSSLSQILASFNSGNVSADSATRIISSTKSVVNNFTIRTGTPTSSGWTQHPAYHLYNTSDADLTAYKGKSVSLLHMDGGAQRHDIVALNSANDGLLYATASSADGSARIERILDGGNYGSLITNLSKQVTFSNGLKAQTNVQMDGGNFSTGSTVTTGNGETTIPNVHFTVSGKTLIITTK